MWSDFCMIRYASLFSGIGGFELGIKQAARAVGANVECVFASEKDKHARKVYERHFGGNCLHGDITKINEADVPEHDILCGGFPCQNVSLAGKREGLLGKSTVLFFEAIRILREKQPDVVFLENVPGLLSSNRGWDFARVLIEMEDAGYDCEWQVLNTKDFGIPQNRERVFIVGHLRTSRRCGQKVFPIQKESCWTDEGIQQTTVRTLTAGGHSGGLHSSMTLLQINNPVHYQDRVYSSDGIAPTLCGHSGGNTEPYMEVHSLYPRSSTAGKGGTGHLSKCDGTTYCLDTVNTQAIAIPVLTPDRLKDRHGVYNGKRIRRLTPKECERLQGFPDNWTCGISDTQRYKSLGNAVTVNVIEAIAEEILTLFVESVEDNRA